MTREEAREAAEVMLAYADGKEIQFRENEDCEWFDCFEDGVLFDYETTSYRVKPEPTYRPYTAEELDNAIKQNHAIVKHKGEDVRFMIIAWDKDRFRLGDQKERTNSDLLKYFTWLDGSPCGIIVE